MPLLMGLGIDYGSYFIAQSEEEQAAGKELRQALVRAFVTTGPGDHYHRPYHRLHLRDVALNWL